MTQQSQKFSFDNFFYALHQMETGGRLDKIEVAIGKGKGPFNIHYEFWAESNISERYETEVYDLDKSKECIKSWMGRHSKSEWSDSMSLSDCEKCARRFSGGPKGDTLTQTNDYWKKFKVLFLFIGLFACFVFLKTDKQKKCSVSESCETNKKIMTNIYFFQTKIKIVFEIALEIQKMVENFCTYQHVFQFVVPFIEHTDQSLIKILKNFMRNVKQLFTDIESQCEDVFKCTQNFFATDKENALSTNENNKPDDQILLSNSSAVCYFSKEGNERNATFWKILFKDSESLLKIVKRHLNKIITV
ncbi:hypothetical protein RFI_11103 [Reticulomyxa filosa]|uniref:Uncharacterized protein n=1 Tax=Reticulomyxa filosa TaxID=46433 RepID=X6NI89_RETFI|nr:hypothetical protein RFI_11103 [Reticulomyxa filosa]|eukprot:ETO26035.1 hypothetical protein RFI_11103 [Reticulomyxa filosa]